MTYLVEFIKIVSIFLVLFVTIALSVGIVQLIYKKWFKKKSLIGNRELGRDDAFDMHLAQLRDEFIVRDPNRDRPQYYVDIFGILRRYNAEETCSSDYTKVTRKVPEWL